MKEKATVRKKRVSRTEAKAEESDSSDLDLKEAAVTPNKNSSPKSSRFGHHAALKFVVSSVADPGCLSRIDPDFLPSRIPDLGSRIQKPQQKRQLKKKLL